MKLVGKNQTPKSTARLSKCGPKKFFFDVILKTAPTLNSFKSRYDEYVKNLKSSLFCWDKRSRKKITIKENRKAKIRKK